MENRTHIQCFVGRTSIMKISYKCVRTANRDSEAVQRLAKCRKVILHPEMERPREEVVLMEPKGRFPKQDWDYRGG